jgi:hypothetical protein
MLHYRRDLASRGLALPNPYLGYYRMWLLRIYLLVGIHCASKLGASADIKLKKLLRSVILCLTSLKSS